MSYENILRAAWFTPLSKGRWGLPILFEGRPGTGKTSRLEQLAAKCKLSCEVVIASLREPSDFLGLPIPGKSESGEIHVHYAPPSWARRLKDAGHGVAFLDELNTAPPAVQAALLRVVLDGAVGDLILPPTVRFVAAQNNTEDAAGGWDLAPPLANRFGHIAWSPPSAQEWGEWILSGKDTATVTEEAATAAGAKAQEASVLSQWESPWAKARGLISGFTVRQPELLFKMPPAGSPDLSRAWASPRCYTADTEVMTQRGWVAWPNIADDDAFATRSPNGTVIYAKATKRFRKHYEGEMIRFHARSLDLTVTPNHNMLVAEDCFGGEKEKGRHRSSETYALKTAADVFTDVRQRPSFAVRIPVTGTWGNIDKKEIDTLPATAWAELTGWILTDGYISKQEKKGSRIVSVTQINPASRQRIGKLFEECGFKPYYAADRVGTTCPEAWARLAAQGRKHDGNRFVPREIMEAGSAVLTALLAGISGGDGWTTREGATYINVGPNQRLAGDIQEAYMRLGGIASVREVLSPSTRRTLFEIHLFKGKKHFAPRLGAEEITKTFYQGDVHCVTVEPNHTLLVRQKGYACWSGNSWEMAARALASAEVNRLSAVETDQFISAFVGVSNAATFENWRVQQDLPDPIDVLDEKVPFKHDKKRFDRTAAVLASCAAIVTPEKADKRTIRATTLWGIIAKVASDAPDITIPAARALSTANLWRTAAGEGVLASKIFPILRAAGLIGSGGAA